MNNPPWQRNFSNSNNFQIQPMQNMIHQHQQAQLSVVSYPNPMQRGSGINSGAINPWANNSGMVSNQQQYNPPPINQPKNCFGHVTKLLTDCGFVDDDIFFYYKVCKGSVPKIGEKVLVEANYSPNTSYKWNATRIQAVSNSSSSRNLQPLMGSNYNVDQSDYRRRSSERHNDRDRKIKIDDEVDRKRRRDERERSRERREKRDFSSDRHKSPIRRSSPKRRRDSRKPVRYMVDIPKYSLKITSADIFDIKNRYLDLYIPSNFVITQVKWPESFPLNDPFKIQPASFHIMDKSVEPPNGYPKLEEPDDTDYLFTAKVMLMGCSPLAEIYSKCLAGQSDERDYIHPTRLISFLVEIRSKTEPKAIGGPWSPSLDGPNPESDPSVLIRTATRHCKLLTGIDLSQCTKWYRFLEIYYHRPETTFKGKIIPARTETTVIFLPDIYSCMPTINEWKELQKLYQQKLETILNSPKNNIDSSNNSSGTSTEAVGDENIAKRDLIISDAVHADPDESSDGVKYKAEHYSKLDPKIMRIQHLKEQLLARNIQPKGLKKDMIARLSKSLKEEKSKDTNEEETDDGEAAPHDDEMKNFTVVDETQDDEETQDMCDISDCVVVDEYDSKDETGSKKNDSSKVRCEEDRARLERNYKLKDSTKIIVHPAQTTLNGSKFDCEVISLSVLLHYRVSNISKRSFEVSLFAEMFNEMLIRDFGFNIYKALMRLPEQQIKSKEEDDNKKEDNGKSENAIPDTEKNKEEDKKQNEIEAEKRGKSRDKNESRHSRDRRTTKRAHEESEDDEDILKKAVLIADKHLHLSFIYFDTSHCGYFYDRDLEELFQIIGLQLSRAEATSLLARAQNKNELKFFYRVQKDKVESLTENFDSISTTNEIVEKEIAVSNYARLPVFEDQTKSSMNKENNGSNWVTYNGCLMDVDKIIDQTKRAEKAREEVEVCLADLKKHNAELQSNYIRACSKIKDFERDVKGLTKKLNVTEDDLASINRKYIDHHSVLISIYDKVSPIFVKPSRERDRDRNDRRRKDDNKEDVKKEEQKKDESKEDSKNDEKKQEQGDTSQNTGRDDIKTESNGGKDEANEEQEKQDAKVKVEKKQIEEINL